MGHEGVDAFPGWWPLNRSLYTVRTKPESLTANNRLLLRASASLSILKLWFLGGGGGRGALSKKSRNKKEHDSVLYSLKWTQEYLWTF